MMIWLVFELVVGASSIAGGIAAAWLGNFNVIPIIIASFIFMVINGITIKQGWCQVPEKFEWIIEEFGAYKTTWRSGLHFIFPFFGFCRIKIGVYMGEQYIKLFMDEKAENGKKSYGKVDFKDVSAGVVAVLFFRVTNSKNAAYNVVSLVKALEEIMDGLLRSYLGMFTLNEAIIRKAQFDLNHLFDGTDPIGDQQIINEKTTAAMGRLLKNIEGDNDNEWGISLLRLLITDIDVPDAIQEQRARQLKAEVDAKAAVDEAKAVITAAKAAKKKVVLLGEAKKEALRLEGDGMAQRVKIIIKDTKLTPDRAAQHAERIAMTDRLPEQSLIITDGGSGLAGLGAQFAAGAIKTQERVNKSKGGAK